MITEMVKLSTGSVSTDADNNNNAKRAKNWNKTDVWMIHTTSQKRNF